MAKKADVKTSKKKDTKKSKEPKVVVEIVPEVPKLTQEQIDEKINHLSERCRSMTRYHLEQVKLQAGEILVEDVDYCINLMNRMVKLEKTKLA
jgi:hypothetical protein